MQSKIIGTKRTWAGDLIIYGSEKNQDSFEGYLFEFEVSRFQKLLARLGQEVFIGDFKAGESDHYFEHYFLFWCQIHRKYFVSYLRGEERRLDCLDCNDEFISSIKNNVSENNKINDRSLKLVKSDRWTKS